VLSDRNIEEGSHYEAIIKDKDTEIVELNNQLNKYEADLEELRNEPREHRRA